VGLWELLPDAYRARDETRGSPLRTLLELVSTQLQKVEDDMAALYDAWFVETSAEWMVVFTGDLLGARGAAALISVRPVPDDHGSPTDFTIGAQAHRVHKLRWDLRRERLSLHYAADHAAANQLTYLDVWERLVTASEDDGIREPAVDGPATTPRRRKASWRVRLTDPMPRSEGYRGIENQLYRVEIHDGHSETDGFAWSRDNGSVVAVLGRWRPRPKRRCRLRRR
jgi:hypothetical protein